MNIHSEALLPDTAEEKTQVYPPRTGEPLNERTIQQIAQVREKPEDVSGWVTLGRLYRRQKVHREAIDAYSMGLTAAPMDWYCHRHKGHTYLNLEQAEEAAAALTMAVRLDPDNWDSWYHLGLSFYALGDFQRAEEAYARTLTLCDTARELVPLVNWYYLTLIRQGKMEKAKEIAALVTKDADIDHGMNYYRLDMVYNGNVDIEEALEWAEKNCMDASGHINGYSSNTYGLAWYLICHGQKERGHQILLKGYELNDWALADTVLRADLRRWNDNND